MKHGEIWLAYPKLEELSKVKLPVKASLGVAKLVNTFKQPYIVVNGERDKLIQKYGKENKETKQISISPGDENWAKFVKDMTELLEMEWSEKLKFDKVKIPEKITETCESCKKNTEVTFQIEPSILVPLVEYFIEVE